jgi:hypothetical protein
MAARYGTNTEQLRQVRNDQQVASLVGAGFHRLGGKSLTPDSDATAASGGCAANVHPRE